MTWEYLHLVTHPFPIVLALTGVGAGIVGWVLGREELERYAAVSLLLAGVLSIPAYYTGIAAADTVASRTFVEPSLVQTHRTWATWAGVAMVTTAVFAGFSLWQGVRRPEDRRLRRFVLLMGGLSGAAVAYAAWIGGHILHGVPGMEEEPARESTAASHELREGPVRLTSAAPAPATPSEENIVTERSAVDSLEERARRLHEEALVVDGHNDLPWRIREEAGLDIDSLQLHGRSDDGHTDIPRLREGGVDVQFWSTYVPAELGGPEATTVELEQIDVVKRLAARFPDHLEMAYGAGDVERIVAGGKIASLVGAEGGHVIANSLPVLRELYRAGARYLTLTHSRTLAWADAATDTARHGGLTEFGRAVVREMNRLGMLVDLSHVSAEAMRDALRVSRAPVIFSHSSARALVDHPRNVPDDVLRMTAENGGVVMVNFYSDFIVPQDGDGEGRAAETGEGGDGPDSGQAPPSGTVGTLADHVEHIARVAGVEHVGLGSDFDGVSRLPEGMEDVSKLPALTVELMRRGFSEQEIRKFLGGNLMRVLRRAEAVAGELRRTEPPSPLRLPYRGLSPEEGSAAGQGGGRATPGTPPHEAPDSGGAP